MDRLNREETIRCAFGEKGGMRGLFVEEVRADRRKDSVEEYLSLEPRKPVIYVPGMGETSFMSAGIRRFLQNCGYVVFYFRNPSFGLGDMKRATRKLGDKIEQIASITGIGDCILLGHGTGGLICRNLQQTQEESFSVSSVITVSCPNSGALWMPPMLIFAAARQSLPSSRFIDAIDDRSGLMKSEADTCISHEVSVFSKWERKFPPFPKCEIPEADNVIYSRFSSQKIFVGGRQQRELIFMILENLRKSKQSNSFETDVSQYRSFLKAYENNPHDTGKQRALGAFLLKEGLFNDAYAIIDKAIIKNSESAELFYIRGLAGIWRTKYEESPTQSKAISDLTKAIKLRPAFPEAYYYRGVIKAILGFWNEAEHDWGQTVIISPDFYRAYLARGYSKRMKGDYKSAKLDYEQVLRLNPEHPEAVKAYKKILAVAG